MDHLNTWFIDHDPLFDAMRAHELGALRWRDFPDYREIFGPRCFPAGRFDEGLSARLVTTTAPMWAPSTSTVTTRAIPAMTMSPRSMRCGPRWPSELDFSVRPRMVAELVAPEAQAWAVDESGGRTC